MPDPGAATVIAYIGVGANLEEPQRQVRRALVELAELPRTVLRATSPLYRTEPVGPQGQPCFINAAAGIATALAPRALLAGLQQIERRHGRVRNGARWGPRTLDLDILLYGDRVVDEPGLHLPHARMHQRAFVLVPLGDIAPADLIVPGRGRLDRLLAGVGTRGVEPVSEALSADA
jgi:2-amino-4-hydroxy-6-hydroxymethyldihydropteridine diphosphokinase